MSQDQAARGAGLDRDPVEELAEEFLQRRRRGEAVMIGEYAERYPPLAERIRDLFPALLLMEDLKPGSSLSHAGGAPPSSCVGGAAQRLGDFKILREIGRGGMGVVYEAEQESLGRRVALKVLPPGWVASPTRLRRFQREAQAAARLHHTNIVPIFGVGEQDGAHYYVMQLIPGQGLDRVLAALGRQTTSADTLALGPDGTPSEAPSPAGTLSATEAARMLLSGAPPADLALSADSGPQEPVAEPVSGSVPADHRYWRSIARIGIQVADALEYAHRQGTLHRDIKPANLLLDNRGTVWIADFGLAKLADLDDLTHSGDMVGTLRYMAPEQFEGKADARSDVYSLGLSLYELLTLRPAFDEKDRRRLIRQVTQEEPPRPRKLNAAIPRDLETIVVKAIASHPEHRYRTAGELAADLRCFLEDRPIRARRASLAGRAWRWCRRNRAVAALAGTALALLVAVAVVASVGYVLTSQALERVSDEREQAEAARRQAEAERTRTKAESERAEANLRLATRAFEEIFSKVAADPVTPPLGQEDDEEWPEPVWEETVTGKDAAMLESMLKFYDQFAQQNQADVKLQRETARAYRRVGDIQQRLGQYDKAETAYRHALATYERLSASTATSGDYLTALAAIHNELGAVLLHTGRFLEARNSHLQAQETLRRQSPEAAAAPESRFELARTYSFLSVAMPGFRRGGGQRSPGGWRTPGPPGQTSEAAENNRRALEILQKLTEEAPDNRPYRLAMARSQRDRYLILAYGGRAEEAHQARQEAVRILEQLIVDAPNNPDYPYELAQTYSMPYRRPRDAKVPESRVEELRRAVELGTELVARYPTVPDYRALLARSHQRSAEELRTAQSLADVDTHLAKAVELHKGLVADFPSVLGYRFFLARSLVQLAEVQQARHEPAQARASLEEAIANSQKIQQSSPAMPMMKMMLAMQYASLAKVLRELGENALADEAAAKAGSVGSHHGPPPFGRSRQEGEGPATTP